MMTPAYKRSYLIASAMVMAAFFSILLTPRADENAEVPDFEAIVPKTFGGWKMLDTPVTQTNLVPQGGEDERFPYDAVLTRAYRNESGNVVLLAIAYTKNQKQERTIHRPELCYYGQGYSVNVISNQRREIAGKTIDVQQLVARQRSRVEPVTYWIRLGERTVGGSWDMRGQLLWRGLSGKSLDGTLVRVSSFANGGGNFQAIYDMQDEFIESLVASVPPAHLEVLIGRI